MSHSICLQSNLLILSTKKMTYVFMQQIISLSNIWKDCEAQLNFSGPWQNISTLWHYLLLQLYKTLPYLSNLASPTLTLPGALTLPLQGALALAQFFT